MALKPTDLRPVMTRIPEGLRRKLEREAGRNDRSMNAEIIGTGLRSHSSRVRWTCLHSCRGRSTRPAQNTAIDPSARWPR